MKSQERGNSFRSPQPARRRSRGRMGALLPRYCFALNRYTDVRFSVCPRCDRSTRLRKIPLVIHIDGFGLLVLRKTSRLCVGCDLLIVHQDELEPLIAERSHGPGAGADVPDYLVLGTVDLRLWRKGLSGGVSVDELVEQMADFKAYLQIEYTPGGWYRGDAGPN